MLKRILKKAVRYTALAVILSSCNSELINLDSGKEELKDITLASSTIGKISFSDFENSMLQEKFGYDREKASASTFEKRRDYLREMLYRDFIFDIAEKNQVDTIKKIKEEYTKKLYSIAIMNGLVNDSLRNKIYSENDVKRTYELKKIKYLPKHILIDSKKLGDDKAKVMIDSIYTMIIEGQSFEKLAKKYSDDTKTAVNGGELGWVFAYDMLKEFEDKVVKMKAGDISKPFKSAYGYHIILLSDAKKNDEIKKYEAEKQVIIRDLDNKNSVKFNQLYFKMVDDLFIRYGVSIDSAMVNLFLTRLEDYSAEVKEDKDPIDSFTTEERSIIISKFGARIIDLNSVINFLKTYSKEKRPVFRRFNDIKMFVIEKFRNELFERFSDDIGYTRNPEFISEAKSKMYEFFKEEVIKQFVRMKIAEPTEEELTAFYEENKEDMFKESDSSYKDFIKVKVSIRNSIMSKRFSTKMNEWENSLFRNYEVNINYSLLENTFANIKDDKK